MNIAKITLLGALALSTQVDAKSCGKNKYKSNNCNYSSGKCNGYKDSNSKNKKGKKGKKYQGHNKASYVSCSGKGVYGCYDKDTKAVSTTKKTSTVSEAPTGELTLNKELVRAGRLAKVSWNVNYPNTVIEDVVDITEDGKVIAKTKLRADVYMIGSAVSNHYDYTQTYIQLGSNSSWKTVYKGYGKDIDRTKVVVSGTINKGDKVSFKAIADGHAPGWVYNTSDNVLVMRNGDTPDKTDGWGGDTSMEDYVRPYMENGSMKLGNRDLIFAAELTHTQAYKTSSGYDSNDSIVLVRFTEVSE